MIIGRHTDRQGRSTGERIAAITTSAEQGAATRLLDSLLDAAADHGVTLDDLDLTADLPGICRDVLRRNRR